MVLHFARCDTLIGQLSDSQTGPLSSRSRPLSRRTVVAQRQDGANRLTRMMVRAKSAVCNLGASTAQARVRGPLTGREAILPAPSSAAAVPDLVMDDRPVAGPLGSRARALEGRVVLDQVSADPEVEHRPRPRSGSLPRPTGDRQGRTPALQTAGLVARLASFRVRRLLRRTTPPTQRTQSRAPP